MDEIIKTDKLSKSYRDVNAVDGVSLNVKKGEIYGFLGLNGAGKTTTIRMLLGMIRPTSGTSYLLGKKVDAGNHKIWENVGYLVETPYAYPELTVRDNLEIFRRLHNISDESSVDTVIDKLQLTIYQNRKSKNLSLVNAQRLGLAKAMLHNPKILILDEPINGLDPAGIVEIRKLLQDLSINKGVTVFISSHILGELAKLVNRIGIIHQGKLIQEVNANKLDQLLHKRLIVNAHNIEAVHKKLVEVGYCVGFTKDGNLELSEEKALKRPEEIANMLVRWGFPPSLLKIDVEDLESYFLRKIGMKGVKGI
ncbi:ABC transporter ATP-binding protein [Clostridium estertheticum]|uniref:ABC transporter ATP-binding protein n=1 Tax=Clostridium estertheticum TaxID=238834 RepID=UPI001C0BE005|nr:ABC transporter ATP-binding protein [Clostridium estertheticum]MBU3174127.1 ABC transporter ATP-binding protein [Clostridium estertheticum]